MKRFTVRSLCMSAVIAALYAALTLCFQAISFGAVQFRVSEAMTLLPVLFPEAVPGLAVGCLISNLMYGANVYDVVFGTLATLMAAILTRGLRKNTWLAALPPVLCNAVIIGLVLTYAYGIDLLWMNMLTVGMGQAVVCYVLGVPLVKVLEKQPAIKNWQA
ncbi:MAG: QueT transporter family protein [Clostridia bacterium]|nr:QueT transporter family protein [Clostridia bacterium]